VQAPPAPNGRGWRVAIPLAISGVLALFPAPAGLPQHTWYYLAIFAGVVAALVLEPLPGGAIGLIGVTLVGVLARWVLLSPGELAQPGFRPENAALSWALSGFSNGTVWLIFSAFMFALGYDKTGLGRRLALVLVRRMGGRTLTLCYAITLADLLLAPFTPSNTARSGGTIFPVVRNLPPLYGSHPNSPSARRIGSCLLWVAIASTCVTSSMFLTGLATNLLAVELVRKTTKITLEWTTWCIAFLPVGLVLLALIPPLTLWLCPPEVKQGRAVCDWAAGELDVLGGIKGREIILVVLVLLALGGWIFGGAFINPTMVALAVVAAMLVLRVISWSDIMGHTAAWNTLVWFATLVALADGLNRTGFITWFAQWAGQHTTGISPDVASLGLLFIFYFGHYFFASTTAHATALLPVMLVIAGNVPGIDVRTFALQLCLTLGIMGIISPYATGPSPIYYGSGYLPAKVYWRLAAYFGVIFFAVYLAIGLPWMRFVGGK
jgi:L-tartrate/succinate antiporter